MYLIQPAKRHKASDEVMNRAKPAVTRLQRDSTLETLAQKAARLSKKAEDAAVAAKKWERSQLLRAQRSKQERNIHNNPANSDSDTDIDKANTGVVRTNGTSTLTKTHARLEGMAVELLEAIFVCAMCPAVHINAAIGCAALSTPYTDRNLRNVGMDTAVSTAVAVMSSVSAVGDGGAQFNDFWKTALILPPGYWRVYADAAFAGLQMVCCFSRADNRPATMRKQDRNESLAVLAAKTLPKLKHFRGVSLPPTILNDNLVARSNLVGLGFNQAKILNNEKPIFKFPNLSLLDKLKVLDLSLNKNLHGKLPASIVKLAPSLNVLNLSDCSHVGVESINSLLQLKNLEDLKLDKINLTGVPVACFWKLSKLVSLSLSYCQVEGPLTDKMLEMKVLKNLNLSHNNLTGPLPDQFGSLRLLKNLDLSHNSLTGRLPDNVFGIKTLEIFTLNEYEYTGPIKGAPKKYRFSWDFKYNRFEGTLPPTLFTPKLFKLNVSNNLLSGEIPKMIGVSIYLTTLKLSNNKFTGVIPPIFGKLANLKSLCLDGNKLTGFPPTEIILMNELRELRLSGNCFNAPLNEEIVEFFRTKKLTTDYTFAEVKFTFKKGVPINSMAKGTSKENKSGLPTTTEVEGPILNIEADNNEKNNKTDTMTDDTISDNSFSSPAAIPNLFSRTYAAIKSSIFAPLREFVGPLVFGQKRVFSSISSESSGLFEESVPSKKVCLSSSSSLPLALNSLLSGSKSAPLDSVGFLSSPLNLPVPASSVAPAAPRIARVGTISRPVFSPPPPVPPNALRRSSRLKRYKGKCF
ncbi:hypothetical protein HK100_010954 [Physocladia obscura]|uniref:Uncharacterized protein n=1 Tax=Physocladia obscura TaxID=109957 RepID=A0AAD5T2U9_9FUNG|nr:hypothetical protein HK100_010954 [Physocladia obscura]